jgi:hypothetical protein
MKGLAAGGWQLAVGSWQEVALHQGGRSTARGVPAGLPPLSVVGSGLLWDPASGPCPWAHGPDPPCPLTPIIGFSTALHLEPFF